MNNHFKLKYFLTSSIKVAWNLLYKVIYDKYALIQQKYNFIKSIFVMLLVLMNLQSYFPSSRI